MASKKSGMKAAAGKSSPSLGGALLKIIAAGVAGSALLLSGAKALGEALLEKQADNSKKLDDRREADKEAVRRIMESEIE